MPWADVASLNLTLLCTSLAAALLAGVLLALEFFASPRLAQRAPGAFALLLAGVTMVACLVKGAAYVAGGCGLLASVILLAWPISFEFARARIIRLVAPKFAWGMVLCTSMMASRFLAAHVLQSLDAEHPPAVIDLEDIPLRATTAFTDKGREIGLFHFKLHSATLDAESLMPTRPNEFAQIIRLGEPNSAANCHGWVFTGGQYGIRDPDIRAILSDNGYEAVEGPREGDLAIYAVGERISHSGIVRIANRQAPILVESKWGPFGIYLHAVDKHPFPGTCKFFRSLRAGHLLNVRQAPVATSSRP